MSASDKTSRPRLASALTVLVAGAAVFALLAAVLPVALASHIFGISDVPNLVVIAATAAVGVVVARHQPSSPMGWLLLGVGGSLMLSAAGTMWLTLDYRIHQGRLPLGWLALLLQPGWAPAIVLLGLTVLLFPDGRLPSRRWRWLLWCYLAAATAWMAGAWGISIWAVVTDHIRVDAAGELASLDNPGGVTAWWGGVQSGFLLLLGFSLFTSIGRQVMSFIRSDDERRQQVKWALAGTAISVLCGIVVFALSSNSNHVLAAVGYAANFGVPALPIGIGIAILKYRLYDIDRIISRTLAYTVVTGLLAGVYAGVVLLATEVLNITSPVAVAAATLVAAALFSPVRARVQRLVDRRFNRARYDADQTVTAFAVRLQDATDLDAVRADLLSVVHRSLEPAHLSVWFVPDAAAARGTPHGSRASTASS